MPQDRAEMKRKSLIVLLGVAAFALLLSIALLAGLPEKLPLLSPVSPTIRLAVVEGPAWDATASLYRVVVEAVVSGTPAPEVSFSRNDGNGVLPARRVLIMLEEGESYLLTATASNGRGRAEASLELLGGSGFADAGTGGSGEALPGGAGNGEGASGGEGSGEDITSGHAGDESGDEGADDEEGGPGRAPPAPPNRPPVISGLVFNPAPLFTGENLTVTAQASDPDGDPLSYRWELRTGGALVDESTGNQLNWRAPSTMGHYTVSVKVSDGRGGQTEHSEAFGVNPVITLSPLGAEFCPETGHIVSDGPAIHGANVYAGDSSTNRVVRGFISFNVDHLTGARVHKVQLRLKEDPEYPNPVGNPEFMYKDFTGKYVGLRIEHVSWGPPYTLHRDYYNCEFVRLIASFYKKFDISLTSVPGGTAPGLAEALQATLDHPVRNERFQLRLRFEKEISNNNNSSDGVSYHQGNIELKIWCLYWD